MNAPELILASRQLAARHFTLGDKLYSRTDSGEWFLSYAPGTWQPLEDTAHLEKLFVEWSNPLRNTTDEKSSEEGLRLNSAGPILNA